MRIFAEHSSSSNSPDLKVMKFGGTSVGSPENIRLVARLLAGTNEPLIVVLSAMAGTTNTLVEIAGLLEKGNPAEANVRINALEHHYKTVVSSLFETAGYREKGSEMIRNHFTYLRSFTHDLFTANEIKCVLAQGELISSALFQFHLEEKKIPSVLLQALNFMRIDREQEPDQYYIRENLDRELDNQPDCKLFITQGFICRNAYGEIDNLRRGGSDFSASLMGLPCMLTRLSSGQTLTDSTTMTPGTWRILIPLRSSLLTKLRNWPISGPRSSIRPPSFRQKLRASP